MKILKANKGFFMLPSIPSVQFLNGTSFKECRKYNGHLTIEEYNKSISKKSEKKTFSDKKFKGEMKDKPLKD